jgi:hypothetical protein
MILAQLRRVCRPAILATMLGACVGATTQLSPLAPGTIEAEQEKQQELALRDNERPPAGYMSDEPGEAGERSRWTILLMGSVDLRRAVEDVQRLGILDDLREVEPGVLSAMVGSEFGMSSTGYNLGRLLKAYKSTVEWDPNAAIVLWRGDRRVGIFGGTGLDLSP